MRLSPEAIDRIKDHIEAMRGTAADDDDEQLATDLQTLLDIALNSKKPAK